LLEGGWSLGQERPGRTAQAAHLDLLASTAAAADLTRVRPHLAHAIRLLRGAGIVLSDRRSVKVQRLIAAAAVLAGRAEPSEADLWPGVLGVPPRGPTVAGR